MQAIGNIANAMARRLPQWRPGVAGGEELARELTVEEKRVFECLAVYAAGIPDGGFDAQSMTLLVNAFSRANIKDSELFSRIAGVAKRLDAESQFDAQVDPPSSPPRHRAHSSCSRMHPPLECRP